VIQVTLTINGLTQTANVSPRTTLADFLREDVGLTGTHLGCEHGVCGACTVLVDGASARACLTLIGQADGTNVETIEGLADDGGRLNPLQEAFRSSHSFQCGFCTPGVALAATELLRENPCPTAAEVREAISGNLCRCTGYQSIVDGIMLASEQSL
jgi:carbon-monoxide dehydrogenase small subunit